MDTVIQYVPRFNLNINIYDKESGILDFNKDFEEGKEEDFTYSKYEYIKISVYYLNNEKVKEICNAATDGKRLFNIRNRKFLESQKKTNE